MNIYPPFVLFVIATFVGFAIWRCQLLGKRRYEVVERALVAAGDAARALRDIRRRESDAAKMAEIDGGGFRPQAGLPTLQRMQEHAATFEELEAATRSVSMHFGEEAGDAFSELSGVYRQICDAHTALFFPGAAERLYPTIPYKEGAEIWKRVVSSDRVDDDLSRQITSIEETISTRFGRYLRPGIIRLFWPL